MNAKEAEAPGKSEDIPSSGPGAVCSEPPLFPDVGVLALVPDHWHWQWQLRHQVMSRLSRYFTILWMNPAEPWRKSLKSGKVLRHQNKTPISGAEFVVHSPSRLLPLFYSPRWLAEFSFRRRLEIARNMLIRKRCKKIVLYVWRPEFAAALKCIPADLSCYHIDDEYSFSAVDSPLSEAEENLIMDVDQVFIHSPALLEKKGNINPHTSFTPNGVDFEAYARRVPEPLDLQDVPRPRIGYSGRLKSQLDWLLLRELTTRHPEWYFVFVGAANAHPEIFAYIDELSRRRNVKFLGEKTTDELTAYPQHFDVCVMPYLQDGYTKYIYPLKLHEYLASGRPVVGTPIPSLEPFRDSVRLPDTVEQWSAAIIESLGPSANTTEARAVRQGLAKAHDWNTLVLDIARTIAQRLGSPYVDLLAQRIQSHVSSSSSS